MDDLFLVVLLLRRGVRVDEHHVLREDLARQGVLVQHQLDRLFDGHVLDEDRGLGIALDVLVEDEIDAGLPRQNLEHHLGGRVAELQRHLGVGASLQARRHCGRPARHIDLAGQVDRRRIAGILLQHLAQDGVAGVVVLALECLAGIRHHHGVAAIGLLTP